MLSYLSIWIVGSICPITDLIRDVTDSIDWIVSVWKNMSSLTRHRNQTTAKIPWSMSKTMVRLAAFLDWLCFTLAVFSTGCLFDWLRF